MAFSNNLEHQVLPIPFYILTLWGMWSPEFLHAWLKRVYSSFTCLVIIAEFVLAVEVFVHLAKSIYLKSFDLDAFFIMTSLTVGLYKGISILLTRNKVVKLVSDGFEDRWLQPRDYFEKNIVTEFFKESRKIHLIYAFTCIAGVSIKLIGPITTANSNIDLPVPAWLPYNASVPIYFWLTYVQQMFVGGATISMHIGIDTIISGLMLQSCTQLKLLQYRLKNFFVLCSKSSKSWMIDSKVERKLMKQYIEDHRFTYEYAETLNRYFAGYLFAILMVVIPNICINVYLLSFSDVGLNIDFITSLALFSISLFQIYLPCWYGNEVMLYSTEMCSAIYEMDWINLSPSTRKALIMIMLRASHPIRMTVAHMIPMDIKSFLSIMKTSYSVLSLLQRIKMEQ